MMHFPFLFSVQGTPLQSGGVGLRGLHHAHRGVLQKQGRIPGQPREGHAVPRGGGGAGAARGVECWGPSEQTSQLGRRHTKWGICLMRKVGTGEPARGTMGGVARGRGLLGEQPGHPRSVALQVCVGCVSSDVP